MPGPIKERRVCGLPACNKFTPGKRCGRGCVTLHVDEYEAIHFIDLEGCTQEQCAAQMEVARSTAQSIIYAAARCKLTECIVNGMQLVIDGGD